MKVKVVDFALVADRALDIYAAGNDSGGRDGDGTEIPSSVVPSEVVSAYETALSGLEACVPAVYTKIAVCVGCFPCMRWLGKPPMLTRLSCSDESLLRRHGISPSGFLDCTENFLSSVCGGIPCPSSVKRGRIVFLKDRLVFAREWVEILKGVLGRKNVDDTLPAMFTDNPGIMVSSESPASHFTVLPGFSRFFASRIAETLKN